VSLCELLQQVFDCRVEGRDEQAYDLLGSLLPFINFTLQDFELFLQVEKRLLVRRGLFETAVCRDQTLTLSELLARHADF
jgi:hypothetical protein